MTDKNTGPWIRLSQCESGAFDAHGRLVEVLCPHWACRGWVSSVDGRIAKHGGAIDELCRFRRWGF
ncbi:hypothetical protein GCM10023318_48080 [Nocardia callitridis]|uniref:Uncharacterized protein n=1 Tax=Nocardia callitridis TaxID=648753 RepID=A0ABP9KTQ2_9NOCA